MAKRPKLTDEDRELFRASVGAVRPLSDNRYRPNTRRPSAARLARKTDRPAPTAGLSTTDPFPEDLTGERLWFARSGIQDRVLRRLQRSRIGADQTLDLHGLTAGIASERLADFLRQASESGARTLRIVHGKGRGSGHRGPVLKALLDRWLRARPEVLAFCSAQPHDGGTGALYVLLRRERKSPSC